jgi:hypothetical protein
MRIKPCGPTKVAELRESCRPGSWPADGKVSTTGMPRIKALAAVRNAALEPLWDEKWALSGGQEVEVTPRSGQEEGGWPATHVVFMNDVFACAGDVIRLLYHDVDMVCGFDAYSTRPRVNRFMVSVRHKITLKNKKICSV